MAHFAVVTPEDAGHMFAMGALANELVRRGHRLTILARAQCGSAGEAVRSAVARVGFGRRSVLSHLLLVAGSTRLRGRR